jgi:TIR domain
VGLLPQFEYDVFVSYAHEDNALPEGTQARYGWVTTLAANLNIGPNVTSKSIFIDHQLKPGDAFDEDLRRKVERSAVLVILLSQKYIDSQWCGLELNHFVASHNFDSARLRDVFVVELAPFDHLEGVPPEIKNLRRQLIHGKFWDRPKDSPAYRLAGYPTPGESGAADLYWTATRELTQALDDRLRLLRGRSAAAPAAQASEPPAAVFSSSRESSTQAPGAILLADVTDDLETSRDEMRTFLKKEGLRVLPEGDYVALSSTEFDQAFAEDLNQSALFVQLLTPTPGRKLKGFAAPLPQAQFARAKASGISILQWCESVPLPGAIGDPAHDALFRTAHLHAVNLERFKEEVADKYRRLQRERQTPGSLSDDKPGRRVVFVDDSLGDQELNRKLREIIKRQNCDIRSLPPRAALGSDGVPIKDVLKICRAGITVYCSQRDHLTAYSRLMYLLNKVAEENLSVSRWAIYFGPDTRHADVAAEFGVDSDDIIALPGMTGVNEQALVDFLSRL